MPKQRSKQRPVNEEFFIKVLLQKPEKTEEITDKLSVDDFTDITLKSIFKKIQEGPADFNSLIAKSEGEEKSVLTRISLEEDFEDPEKVLNDCIRSLKDNQRTIILNELQQKIRQAEQQKNTELVKTLHKEYYDLKTRKDI